MKSILLLISLVMSLQAFANNREETMECVSDEFSYTVKLTPTSNYVDATLEETKQMCSKHTKIQFDWEKFSFFKVEMNGRTFSGVACNEDVNFEFKSAQKVENKSVGIRIWLDELFDSRLTIGGKEYKMDCEYVDPSF